MAEVDAFGRERCPTADLVDSAFPFTNAVIQEGLRLYPPATTAVREGKERMTLGGCEIPAATALQVSHVGCPSVCVWLPLQLCLKHGMAQSAVAAMHMHRHACHLVFPAPNPPLCAVFLPLQVSIYSMHRSERYWRDPLAFKPERFLPGTPEAAEVRCAASSCCSRHCCCSPAPPAAGPPRQQRKQCLHGWQPRFSASRRP